jgi:hypothetical protein
LAAASLVLVPAVVAQQRPGGNLRPVATVLVEVGQVSVLKDGYPMVLNQGDGVQAQQTIVTGQDGYARFQLEDKSTFEVFGNSKVVFHDNYPSLMDMLYVWIGRVKIFVEHSNGPNPKRVTTPTAVISVRGTVYDVVVEDDEGTTFVTVDDGAVAVRNHTAPGNVEVLLRPGDSVRVFRGQPLQLQQIDHAAIMRVVLKAAQNALYQVVYGRSGPPVGLPGGTGGGTAPGPQGDPKPKNGGGTGTGSTNGAPAPPSGPPASGGH